MPIRRHAVFRRRVVPALLFIALLASACGGGGNGWFRQYEYEEEIYLSLDGSATVYVNGSVAALNALRGTAFDTSPIARIDRAAVREYFSSANTHVARVSTSRRSGRQFVHIRLDVDDIRRLSASAPFAWSTYDFVRDDDVFRFQQTVGPATGKDVGRVGWTGGEIVAFRLHLPSKIAYHNTQRAIGRGNILVWEQPLAERLRGAPLTFDARMETESILYRTLWLFGWTFVAVAVVFLLVIWWVLRRGPNPVEA